MAPLYVLGTLFCPAAAQAQFSPRYDWVYRRELHDLMGQSYRDYGPRGWGYYTPQFLPGFDDSNGPSRAYMPIFNAPEAAPADSMMRPERLFPPRGPRDPQAPRGVRGRLRRLLVGR